MSWYTKRVKLGACTVGAVAAAVLAAGTTPAAASGTFSGLAYVYGAGTFGDDWNNEGVLSTSTHAYSNATCLWQKILWADGKIASSSDIDGIFGTQTYNATKAWQQSYGDGLLTVDGVVGKGTFGRAGGWVGWTGGSEAAGQTLNLIYVGTAHRFDLKRDTDGNYQFVDGDGAWRKAGYDYRSCS
ncbi:peptidoglycan-binding domain-containing protein [Streptomyces atratus]|uniref:peptidoglycan-binding domain-containing protein n=1 Tax=Streptomyces atratus TaxID=1893 RepID=UPI003406646F